MVYALPKGSTTTNRNTRVMLGAWIDPTLSLSHYNECPRLYEVFYSLWGQAAMQPRSSHLFHDLISQIFLHSLQFGVTVMDFIDAFVYAHHQHRRNIENPGNFGDNMKGRIRFMTAITPAYGHAYQATCLTRHIPAILCQNFRLPKPKAWHPHLPNVRSATFERSAATSEDGLFIQMEARAA